MLKRWWVVLMLVGFSRVEAYPVGAAVPLEREGADARNGSMTKQADLIVKGTVVGDAVTSDAGFQKVDGYVVHGTRLRVVSVVKGLAGGEIEFRHYAKGGEVNVIVYMPQQYEMKVGKTYVVFAKKGSGAGGFQQLWMNHTSKEDQGVLRCADAAAVDAGSSVTLVVWNELMKLMASEDVDDVVYGIKQLEDMSGGMPANWAGLKDYDKRVALEEIAPLLKHRDERVVLAAVNAVGAGSPWMGNGREEFWLASLPGSNITGLGAVPLQNQLGELWRELARVAETATSETVKVAALRALGGCREAELYPYACKWTGAERAAVRANATLLLSGFTTQSATVALLERMLHDADGSVRSTAANAIAGGHVVALLPQLEAGLTTGTQQEREAVAKALIAFPFEDVKAVLERHVDDGGNVGAAFVNVLGTQEPEKHVARLVKVLQEGKAEPLGGGGTIPAYAAWHSLVKYLKRQDAADFKAGKFDAVLDAMEQSKHTWSSSEPQNLYAIELVKGLPERAEKFRALEKGRATYDIDYYFKQAQERPGDYFLD